jgi:hypothetical protein
LLGQYPGGHWYALGQKFSDFKEFRGTCKKLLIF